MRPKIEAAMGFVAETGRSASIGRLEDAAAVVAGVAGTPIDAATTGLMFR
jgi:carbamate kinase